MKGHRNTDRKQLCSRIKPEYYQWLKAQPRPINQTLEYLIQKEIDQEKEI